MSEPYSTVAGVVTRGETFMKMLHHIDELRNLACIMSHLHNTEDSDMDKLMAKGWLGVNEMFGMMRVQIVQLAKRGIQ